MQRLTHCLEEVRKQLTLAEESIASSESVQYNGPALYVRISWCIDSFLYVVRTIHLRIEYIVRVHISKVCWENTRAVLMNKDY